MKKKLELIKEFISDQQEAIDSMKRFLKRRRGSHAAIANAVLEERIASYEKVNKALTKIVMP